ncbi:hypothetical protein ACFSO7_00385 [Bacillus sp. CGMCC 1.16607]|uniref:hypothetical protein n=1 Tax=Bacillus sp. CGMCC 1.16607 TaxID=3351842 RepID=UPI003636F31E
MSLTRVHFMEIVKKQYIFKLKANIDSFSSLVGIQLLGLLFSLGGVGGMGTSSDNITINVKYYSSDLVIIFTMFWALSTGITITTKPFRYNDFTFVTNRLSSNLSNVFFLLTASTIGGITAMLAGYFVKCLGYFIFEHQFYSFSIVANELFVGILVTILYVFCMSAFGYLVGTLVQLSKIFIGFIPILIFGSLFLDASLQREPSLGNVYQFYFMEPSVALFIVKIVITTALIFIAAISILNRMEVRR